MIVHRLTSRSFWGIETGMFIDFHNDTFLKTYHYGQDFVGGSSELHIDYPKIRSDKRLAGLFFAACPCSGYRASESFDFTDRLVKYIKDNVERCPDGLRFASSSADFERNIGEGACSAFLAVEGGVALDEMVDNVDHFYERGVRLITLSHLVPSSWVGSCHEKGERGLTGLGRDMVRRMNELGIIVDLAHSSERTILDTIEISKSPVVSSHGGAKAVFDNERTLSDRAMRAIADTGGLVSIMLFPDLLAPRSDIDPLAVVLDMYAKVDADVTLSDEEKSRKKNDIFYVNYPVPEVIPQIDVVFEHIEYTVNLIGDDHVAIGSDYDGIPYVCRGVDDISKFGNLADFMREKGYSEARIAKIMGGNIKCLISRVL